MIYGKRQTFTTRTSALQLKRSAESKEKKRARVQKLQKKVQRKSKEKAKSTKNTRLTKSEMCIKIFTKDKK